MFNLPQNRLCPPETHLVRHSARQQSSLPIPLRLPFLETPKYPNGWDFSDFISQPPGIRDPVGKSMGSHPMSAYGPLCVASAVSSWAVVVAWARTGKGPIPWVARICACVRLNGEMPEGGRYGRLSGLLGEASEPMRPHMQSAGGSCGRLIRAGCTTMQASEARPRSRGDRSDSSRGRSAEGVKAHGIDSGSCN
jgi:hypothetical protein